MSAPTTIRTITIDGYIRAYTTTTIEVPADFDEHDADAVAALWREHVDYSTDVTIQLAPEIEVVNVNTVTVE